MSLYSFYFFDSTGSVTHRHSMQLPTDEAATGLGRRLLSKWHEDEGVEIWRLNHLVRRETRADSND